ncbi:site-specific integrase [Pseudomonas fluorescens]|uniref:site-specific integrase n=1 Tax=Pseudomonas fluorescens TaxID=294 RepID=UPI0009BC22D0|nr:site-specific integrase [Pseudomonas fluorescens]
MRPGVLLQEYLMDHDLRKASIKIYGAAIKSLEKHFGQSSNVEEIDRRDILAWRNRIIEQGLSKRSWNTYSNHLRTIWGYAIEYGILAKTLINPFKKTTLIPPKRPSKIVSGDGIRQARDWLRELVDQEECSGKRSHITPAWFWLATFEMFYYTGIRLNALLCIRLKDIDWHNKLVCVNADTEKTHREFCVPITKGLEPHIERLLKAATAQNFSADDQLFNVNRFSIHYRSKTMNIDQVEGMYKKLTKAFGIRITPHRFRHTLATDLMRHPERNIHLTKSLLNHSNIATTMSYIEVDYEHMRVVLDERSWHQGAIRLERREDTSPPSLPANQYQLPPPGDCPSTPPVETPEQHHESHPAHVEELPTSRAPTACELLAELPRQRRPDKYPLDQISKPTTGLSHELSWDGPGTLWADLGIPPCRSPEESFDPATLMDLMPDRCTIGSFRWS